MFYRYMVNVGNTVTSAVLIALKECMKEGRVHSGMNVIYCGFSFGLSWDGTFLEF